METCFFKFPFTYSEVHWCITTLNIWKYSSNFTEHFLIKCMVLLLGYQSSRRLFDNFYIPIYLSLSFPDHLFSTDSCVVKSEMLIATPQSCLPTLVHVGQGNHDRDLQSPITESGKPSSTAGEDSSSRLFAAKRCASAGSSPGMRSGCERNGFDSMGTSEHRVMFDNGGARSEYEDNMLLMKQAEHEQRMKNLKLEREMKQEEHVLRLDVLKEETELVRLRKELLKRQLESYINVVNA